MSRRWLDALLADSDYVARLVQPGPIGRRERLLKMARARHTLRTVAEALDVPFILLKGEPLAREIYPSVDWRDTMDVDLLIEPRHIERSLQRLADAGFELQGTIRPWTYNQVTMTRSNYAPVEVHWRLALPTLPAPSTTSLFANSKPLSFDDVSGRRLDSESLLIHLGLHFAQHVGFPKGLVDIACWMDTYEAETDWRQLISRVSDLGVSGMVRWPLKLLRLRTGISFSSTELSQFVSTTGAEDPLVEISSDLLDGEFRNEAYGLPEIHFFFLQTIAGIACVDGLGSRLRALLLPLVIGPHRWGTRVAHALDLDRIPQSPDDQA